MKKCEKRFGISAHDKQQLFFMAANSDTISLEMASGRKEYTQALAHLMGCPENRTDYFARFCHANFGRIFRNKDDDFTSILVSLKEVTFEDPVLAGSCNHIY